MAAEEGWLIGAEVKVGVPLVVVGGAPMLEVEFEPRDPEDTPEDTPVDLPVEFNRYTIQSCTSAFPQATCSSCWFEQVPVWPTGDNR